MSHFYDHILAGFVAGASSVAISHPLDTVKVRLQTNKNYKNTVDCFVKTLNGEGVAGFYKGMAFPLASAAVYNACVFGVYKNVLELMTRNQTERESYTQVAIASSVAGAASVTIGTPVDLIKIKLQVQTNGTVRNIGGRSARKLAAAARLKNVLSESHRGISNVALLGGRGRGGSAAVVGPVQCAMDIVQREGVSGLYRGATAMLARDIPGYAIYFVPYEAMVRWMQLRSGDESFGAAATCAVVSGGVAGTISWGLMHPVALHGARQLLESGRVKCLVTEMDFDLNTTEDLISMFSDLERIGFHFAHLGSLDYSELEITDSGSYPAFITDSKQLQELFDTYKRIRSFDERSGFRVYSGSLSLDRNGNYFDYSDLIFACRDGFPSRFAVEAKGTIRFKSGVWWIEKR